MQQKAKYQDYKSDMFNQENNITKLVEKDSPIKIETENIEIFKLSVEENYSLKLEQSSYYSIYLINGEAKIIMLLSKKMILLKFMIKKC